MYVWGTPPKIKNRNKQNIMTYSSSIAMQRRTQVRRGRNVVSFKETTRTIGPVSNTILLIVLACLIGLLYLAQVTKTNSYGYTINSLQEQSVSLQEEKAALEVSAARLQSLDRVKNSAVAQGLVNTPPAATVQN